MAGVCPVASKACYNGAMGTQGVGVCKPGVSFCAKGVFGPCIGEVLPSAESCNNLDDDCNKTADDGLGTVSCGTGACKVSVPACTAGKPTACVPKAAGNEVCGDQIDNNCDGLTDEGCGCVYVSPTGNDNNAGTAALPKRTINKAIAAAGQNGFPNQVCVASGAACPSTGDYIEDVVMKNGVNVYGGYQATGNNWPRNTATCATRILPGKPIGVYFDKSVVLPTVLDGFVINGHADNVSAAVTVEGSTGAVVSGNTITGGGQTTSYGVNVTDSGGQKGTPTIARNAISGGSPTALSVGVRSQSSAPIIQAHCDVIDVNGRCTGGCFNGKLFIRSRIRHLQHPLRHRGAEPPRRSATARERRLRPERRARRALPRRGGDESDHARPDQHARRSGGQSRAGARLRQRPAPAGQLAVQEHRNGRRRTDDRLRERRAPAGERVRRRDGRVQAVGDQPGVPPQL
ncbi:MAG: DUF1565 domain-containing protein [Myxococcales bacterium]|nr:DUF1565 domain-containing protein [Myxococcales bacterium]